MFEIYSPISLKTSIISLTTLLAPDILYKVEANSTSHFTKSITTGTATSMALNKILFSSIQSRKATKASPTAAVISRMLAVPNPNACHTVSITLDATLKAKVKPPPITIVMRSRTANTPFNVRVKFSEVSSPITRFSVKL